MIVCIPDVLDLTELREIRTVLDAQDFQDGKRTAGKRAKRVKHNEQLAPGESPARKMVLNALRRHPEFQRAAIPKTIRPPLISRYRPGMQYGLHVDDALMGPNRSERTDLSATVFLNNVDDYDGGELEIQSPFGRQEVKLPAGAAVVYPSSTLHRVLPVTRGERLVAVTWVHSLVRDAAQREILYDLQRVRELLCRVAPDEDETDLAFKSHSNLLRMWSEP